MISIIAQTKVSLDGIASYLRLDEVQDNAIEKMPKGGIMVVTNQAWKSILKMHVFQ